MRPPASSPPALPLDTLSPVFLSPAFSKLNRIFTAPAILAAPPTDGARSVSTVSGPPPAVGSATLAQAEARDIARAEEAFREALDERLKLWRERCLPFIGLLMTQADKTVSTPTSSASLGTVSRSPSPPHLASVAPLSSPSSAPAEAAVFPESLLSPYLAPCLSTFSVLSASFLRPADEKISALFFELCVAVASGGFSYSKATDFLVKKALPNALFHFVLIAADLRRAAALTHAAAQRASASAPGRPLALDSPSAETESPEGAGAGAPPAGPSEEAGAHVSTPKGKADGGFELGMGTPSAAASAPSPLSGTGAPNGHETEATEHGARLAPEVVALEAALRRCFFKTPCSPETVDVPAALEFIASTFFPRASAKSETEDAKGGGSSRPDSREKSQRALSVSGVFAPHTNVHLPACSLQSLLPLPFRALLLDAVTVTTEMCVHADPVRVEFRRAQSNLGAFLRLLETGHVVTPVDICAFGSSIRLDDLAWPRLAPSVGGGRKRVHELLIKERTKRKFTLTVYNLCRENIGLYARLHAALLAYVESPVRISSRICLKAVAAIVGEGSLCPSRTLATILSVYEDHLFSHNQLLPLVSLFSPEKLLEVIVFELHLYAELRRQRDVADEDAALTILHAQTLPATSAGVTSVPGGTVHHSSSSPAEMGTVARSVQNRAAEGPSPNFYRMLALFVMKGIISLEALYPHLLPADALLSALFARTASRYQAALRDAKGGVLPAPPKPELSVQAQFDQALPGVLAACGVAGDSAGDGRRDGATSGPAALGANGPAGTNPGAGPGSGGGPNMPHPPSSTPFGYYGRAPMHSPSGVNHQGGPPGWTGSPGAMMSGGSSFGAPFSSLYGYPPPLHGSGNALASRNVNSNSPHYGPTGADGAGFFASGAGFGANGAPGLHGAAGGAGTQGRANPEREREAREKIEKEKKALEKKLVEKEKELRDKDAGNPLLNLPGAREYLLYDEQGVRFALEKIYGMEIGKFRLLAAFLDFNGTAFAHQLLLHFTAKLHVNPCLNGAVQKSLARYINWLLGPLCARRPKDSLALYLATARPKSGSPRESPLFSQAEALRALRPLCRDARGCNPSLCAHEPYWLGAVLRREDEKAEVDGEKERPLVTDAERQRAKESGVKHEGDETEPTSSGDPASEAQRPVKRVKTEREENGADTDKAVLEADSRRAAAEPHQARSGGVSSPSETARARRETGASDEADGARRQDGNERFIGLAPAEAYEDFFVHILPLLRYMGASLAFDTNLFSSVLCVLTGVAEEERESRKRRGAGKAQTCRTQLDDVLVELIFPALSQVPFGASVLSAKVWGVLELLPASRRYAIYTRVMDAWLSETSHPMTLNYEVVRVRLRKLLKRLTSTIFEDRLKAKERTLLSEISALSRIAPGPVADLFLHQTDLFDDNMVKTLAEAARSLAPLSADIFLSRFIHRQLCRDAGDVSSAPNGKGRGGAGADICGPPKQLVNRAALTGRFLKIHYTTDLQPLLVSTILRLWRDFDASQVLSPAKAVAAEEGERETDASAEGARAKRDGLAPRLVGENRYYPADLLGFWRDKEYIEKLIELMGDCPKLPEAGALTADQIYAQGGGPLLKAEVMLAAEDDSPCPLPRSGEDEDPAASDRRGAAAFALREALSKRDIFTPLLFILAKQRVEVFYDGDFTRSLRSFGSTFDDLQTYHLQVVDFLSRYASPSATAYASLLPPVREIFARFEPAMAWTIIRPGLADFLETFPAGAAIECEEKKRTERDKDAQDPPAAPERGSERDRANSGQRDRKTEKEQRVVRLTSTWQTRVRPTVEEYLAEKQLNGLSMDFFLLFWRLSLSDIYVPDRQYEACLARLDAGVKQSLRALEDLEKQRRSTASWAAEQQKGAEEPLKARLSRLQRRHRALQAEWHEHKRRFDAVRRALRSLDSLDWFGSLGPSSFSSSPSSSPSSPAASPVSSPLPSPSSGGVRDTAQNGETAETGEAASAARALDEKENREDENAKDGGAREGADATKGGAEVAKTELSNAAGGLQESSVDGRRAEALRGQTDKAPDEDAEMEDDALGADPSSDAVSPGLRTGVAGVKKEGTAGPALASTPCARKGGPLAIQAFVKFLLAPRLLNAEVDALFCSHFVMLLLELRTPRFNYLAFTNVWTKMLTPLVRCSTVREAQLLGLFVNEMLAPLSRWLKNQKAFEKDTGGNSCFGRTFRESESIPAAQLEKGAKKWESRIFESLVQGLPEPSASAESSASPSQWMAAKAVVVFLSRCHANFPLSYTRGVELMTRLEHVVELAQAWGWKDVSLSASSILKTLDKYRRERSWYQSPPESEEKAASHSSGASSGATSSASKSASSSLPPKGGAKNALTSVSMSGASSHGPASPPSSSSGKKDASAGAPAAATASPRGATKSPSVSREAASSKPAPAGRPKASASAPAPPSGAASGSPRPKGTAPASSLASSRPNPRVPEPLKKAGSASAGKGTEAETGVSAASGRSASEGEGNVEPKGGASDARSREHSEEQRRRETSEKVGQAGQGGHCEDRKDAERREREEKAARAPGDDTNARGKDTPSRPSRSRSKSPGDRESKRQRRENEKESEKAPLASAEAKGNRGRSASVSGRDAETKESVRSEGAKPRGTGPPATAPASAAKKCGKEADASEQPRGPKSAVAEKLEASEKRTGGKDERQTGVSSPPVGPREDALTHKDDDGREKRGSAARKRRQDETEPPASASSSFTNDEGGKEKATSDAAEHASSASSRGPPTGKSSGAGEARKVGEERPGSKGEPSVPSGESGAEKKKAAPRPSAGAPRDDRTDSCPPKYPGKKEETQRKPGASHPASFSASRGGSAGGGSRTDRGGDAALASGLKVPPKSGSGAPTANGPQGHPHSGSSGGPHPPGGGDRGGGSRGGNVSFSGPRRSSAASGGSQAGRLGPGDGPVAGPPNSKWGAPGPGGPPSVGSHLGFSASHHTSSFHMPPPPAFGHNHGSHGGHPSTSQHGGPMRNVNAYSASQYTGGSHGYGPHNPQGSGANLQGQQAMGVGGPGGPQARNALFGPSKGQHAHRHGGSHHRSGHHQR
ncbi:hypothetical protein NCLIV_035850 [Neospora caninum Liverpool]|uniref:Transcription factor/nuclear export subunit 2 n=1 Tax=Neospora caninum (strain Liverpool) TaxID=572307 RepID=F0VJ93_NEOCL|nr:hypothetical protein NCLIV_035850 [Neospora caninum Liverpool]CBZ53804.1 hypothetical protein NCLIV_035850 [Neospora caninum Liverpool]CEL67798.1 TPA: hypothetical protein BN1204_035850 [Neospora caninum Liverpool]|eukprot:XP_003883836.1 hypothetical protein NCLIV_035850 [Neospora caninum Liverpool]